MTLLKRGPVALAQATSQSTSTSDATVNLTTGGGGGGTTARFEKGSVFANRYEIQDTAGKGGMGVVYRAHDRQLDEEVALKLLRPEGPSQQREPSKKVG